MDGLFELILKSVEAPEQLPAELFSTGHTSWNFTVCSQEPSPIAASRCNSLTEAGSHLRLSKAIPHCIFICPSSCSCWPWFCLPKRSPVLFTGKDDLLMLSEDAALMGVWPRERRHFRTSPENTTALPAPSPALPNPVSDALLVHLCTLLCPHFCLPPCFDPEQRTEHSELGFTLSFYWIQAITIH